MSDAAESKRRWEQVPLAQRMQLLEVSGADQAVYSQLAAIAAY